MPVAQTLPGGLPSTQRTEGAPLGEFGDPVNPTDPVNAPFLFRERPMNDRIGGERFPTSGDDELSETRGNLAHNKCEPSKGSKRNLLILDN